MDKIPIWGSKVPYNNKQSKLNDMVIDYKQNNKQMTLLKFLLIGIRGKKYKDRRKTIDTMTYLAEIKLGYGKETYEDVPYIKSFLVSGSEKAVLVVPGGGFSYKQSDFDGEGNQGEGDMVSRELNKAGVSAFVLWYRTNPYCFPVPLLDMQRAVRYIRFHAKEFGINPNKISAIGFSGGGYEIAGLLNLLHGDNRFPQDYEPDEVDAMKDTIETAGLIYPCVSFKGVLPIMSACFKQEDLETDNKRENIYDQYSCVKNFCSSNTPQFFCYGGKDIAIPIEHEEEYIEKLKESRTDHEILFLPKANHGFCVNPKMMKKYGYWVTTYLKWYKNHT